VRQILRESNIKSFIHREESPKMMHQAADHEYFSKENSPVPEL